MFAFTGEMGDESGLTYLRARYLDNGVGRFITRDTWGGDSYEPISYNAWLYVYANPTNFTDPTGHVPCNMLPPEDRANCEYDEKVPPRDITWLSNRYLEQISLHLAPIYDRNGQLIKRTNAAQFQISGHEITCNIEYNENGIPIGCIEGTICNQNLCGQVAMSAIAYLFDNAITAQTVVEALNHPGCSGTGYDELINFLNNNFGEYLSASKQEFKEIQLPNDVARLITSGHIVFPAVNITSGRSGADLGGIEGQVGPQGPNGIIGHWVLITGVAQQWDFYDPESAWNWVRIFNPFDNQAEYYWWDDFDKAWFKISEEYEAIVVLPK